MSPSNLTRDADDSKDMYNIVKGIRNLSILKCNAEKGNKTTTRNQPSTRKTSCNLLPKRTLFIKKGELGLENQSYDRRESDLSVTKKLRFNDPSSPKNSIAKGNARVPSPNNANIESPQISSKDSEQILMKKYLNESERVLRIIVKKLVKILDDLKIELKFPRKDEYKYSSKLYRYITLQPYP